jgi:CheY-like chemotaxis protein
MAEYNVPNDVVKHISHCSSIIASTNPFIKKSQSVLLTTFELCGCKTLIIVDDSPFNLMVLEGFLKKLGLGVQKAFNGQEACKLMESNSKCKCSTLKGVLTDCEMPVMNGFDEAIAIRKQMKLGVWKRVPIIAVTAYSDEFTKSKCIESGMDACLTKPVNIRDLKSTLEKYGII